MDISILKVLAKIHDVGKLAYKSLQDVDMQVRDLHDKLEFLMAWIQVAEERNMIQGDKLVDVWVSQLRRAVWEAEDIVDEYFEVCQSRLEPEPTASRVWPCVPDWRVPDWVPSWALPRRLPCFPLSEVPVRYELSRQIQNVLRQLDEIQNNNMQARVDGLPNSFEAFDRPTMDSLENHERHDFDDVIGFHAYIRSIVSLLVGDEGKRGGTVIVTGESGIGKTSVAREVLKVWDVQRYFDVCAWVCLPPKSRVNMYLDQIWEQAQGQTHCGNAPREDVKKVLAEMRLLVVLDGVDGVDELMDLLGGLPVGAKGSRILVTTQIQIHRIIKQRRGHDFESVKIERLERSACLDLLSNRLSSRAREIIGVSGFFCTDEYVDKIYEISGGLPLAVVLLAGLIYFKDHGRQVREVFNMLESYEHKRLIKRILTVSYATMPTILKMCFLYFAAMPPNVPFEVKKLLSLWYAVGIPEPRMCGYLEALVSRGLVQLVGDDGICIHQSVHGFAKDMACKAGIIEHHSKFDIRAASTVRGISIHNYIDSYVHMDNYLPKLRTFVGDFAEDSVQKDKAGTHPSGSQVASSSQGLNIHQLSSRLDFLCQSKFIRVVDLQGLMLGKLPDSIGDMIHLRHLGLRRCCLKDLPPSLAKLMNLETLDITGNDIKTIVDGFWKIGSLENVLAQNLSLPMSAISRGLPTRLETLHGVVLSPPWTQDDFPEIRNPVSFQVVGTTVANVGVVAKVLGKMWRLQHLKIAGDCILLPNRSFHSLESIEFDGEILEDEVAAEPPFSSTARKILLRSSCLLEKSLHIILPTYLRELELLDNSFIGSKLLLEDFEQLVKLKLGNLKLMEELVVGKSIRTLEIFGCPNMKKIQGLKNAEYLQNVILHDMAASITAQVGPEDKQLSDKIKHVRTAAWARTTPGGGRPTRDTSPNRRQLAKD